jgi:VIT1/CCC1 family predicted Fe2+/Mn2+ transporter
VTLLALAAFGAVKARFTGVPMLRGAIQTVVVGGVAAGVAYGLARLVSQFGAQRSTTVRLGDCIIITANDGR